MAQSDNVVYGTGSKVYYDAGAGDVEITNVIETTPMAAPFETYERRTTDMTVVKKVPTYKAPNQVTVTAEYNSTQHATLLALKNAKTSLGLSQEFPGVPGATDTTAKADCAATYLIDAHAVPAAAGGVNAVYVFELNADVTFSTT